MYWRQIGKVRAGVLVGTVLVALASLVLGLTTGGAASWLTLAAMIIVLIAQVAGIRRESRGGTLNGEE